jgi:hypothetical protein
MTDEPKKEIRATDHGFLCNSPCTPFYVHGDCYCVEKIRARVLALDDALLDALEAQGWKNLRASLRAERG